MSKIFLFIFINISLFASSLSLVDLGYLASKQIHKTFVFSSSVDKNIKIVFNDTPLDYYSLFQTVAKSNGFKLTINKTFIFVDIASPVVEDEKKNNSNDLSSMFKIDSHDKTHLNNIDSNFSQPNQPSFSVVNAGKTIFSQPLNSKSGIDLHKDSVVVDIEDNNISFKSFTLKYISPADAESSLKFSGFDYSIAPNSKTIIFKVPFKKIKLFDNFVENLKTLDILRSQLSIKFTVFDSTDDLIRDIGVESKISIDSNFSIDTKKSVFSGPLVGSFYAKLHLSEINGKSKTTDSPEFLVSDNQTMNFDSVANMPFLDTDFAFSAVQGTSQSKKYKYQPIGFKITCTPTIIGDNVYLDLILTYGSIVSGGDLPVTSEKTLKNRFTVRKGDLILLAGISKSIETNSTDSVPYLSKIPFLGKLFIHDSSNKSNQKLNIAIEVK